MILSKIGFCNGMGEMFELLDISQVIEFLDYCYELGLKGFQLTNGVGGYSNCADTEVFLPAQYYYNFSLSAKSLFSPEIPPQTNIQRSFPLYKFNCLASNMVAFTCVSDLIRGGFNYNRRGLAIHTSF